MSQTPAAHTTRISVTAKTVIGTGDPFDGLMLIPLIADWGVPRECITSITGDPCTERISRLYVLEEPLCGFGGGPDGFKVVGVCEKHHAALARGEA